MTPEEFVTYLRELNTPDGNSINFYRQGGRAPREADITSANLLQYLKKMQTLNPKILLVGEAPGYKGCKLTGVPFTSEFHILTEDFFKIGFEVLDPSNLNKENSASTIWNILRTVQHIPLMWNIYPFHPHTTDGKNRKPKSRDIKLGKEILNNLLTLFNIESIYCVGTTSLRALETHPLFRSYIRHPSHGGSRECTKRLKEILELN